MVSQKSVFNGLKKLINRKSIISISGSSGTGKTSLSEFLIGNLLIENEGCCMWIQASEAFPKKRLEIMERDDFTCQFPNCGNRENGKAFLVHHVNYNKEDHRKENLITLDNSCHAKTNYNREFWKNYFNQKIKEELNDFTTS